MLHPITRSIGAEFLPTHILKSSSCSFYESFTSFAQAYLSHQATDGQVRQYRAPGPPALGAALPVGSRAQGTGLMTNRKKSAPAD